jgi:hypothetical protein
VRPLLTPQWAYSCKSHQRQVDIKSIFKWSKHMPHKMWGFTLCAYQLIHTWWGYMYATRYCVAPRNKSLDYLLYSLLCTSALGIPMIVFCDSSAGSNAVMHIISGETSPGMHSRLNETCSHIWCVVLRSLVCLTQWRDVAIWIDLYATFLQVFNCVLIFGKALMLSTL